MTILAILGFLVSLLPIQSTTVPAAQTVLDRVFTHEQADRGERIYETQCVKCHEGNDPEGPTLMGRTFIERWREDDLQELYLFINDRMPADAPGKLGGSEAIDVLAFLLRANNYAEGTQPLSAEALPRIILVGPDGPKPFPPNTLVQTVGCLSQGPGSEWSLTQAAAPVRSRNGKETSAEELKRSAAHPLGTQTFVLRNFTNIDLQFKPDRFAGHKIQVKGVLIRSSEGERISLTSLETLAPACGGRR